MSSATQGVAAGSQFGEGPSLAPGEGGWGFKSTQKNDLIGAVLWEGPLG